MEEDEKGVNSSLLLRNHYSACVSMLPETTALPHTSNHAMVFRLKPTPCPPHLQSEIKLLLRLPTSLCLPGFYRQILPSSLTAFLLHTLRLSACSLSLFGQGWPGLVSAIFV